jgi:hypothetical protein
MPEGFRKRWFKHRVAALLLILCGALAVRAAVRIDEQRPVDWSRPHRVSVCPLLAPGTDATALASRLRDAPARMEAWAGEQHEYWTGVKGRPFEFVMEAPVLVTEAPPFLPEASDSFWTRWRETRAFLEYLEAQSSAFPARRGDDTRIFLYVYRGVDEGAWRDRHSVGTRRGRFGVVFASDAPRRWENVLCVVLHETLHAVGAPDHRRSDDTIGHPEGYADPSADPLYPQKKAEIMALGIPVDHEHELRVDALDEVVMGLWTAQAIGWR